MSVIATASASSSSRSGSAASDTEAAVSPARNDAAAVLASANTSLTTWREGRPSPSRRMRAKNGRPPDMTRTVPVPPSRTSLLARFEPCWTSASGWRLDGVVAVCGLPSPRFFRSEG